MKLAARLPFLFGVCLAIGCQEARYPNAADMAAGVELGAVAVHAADVACAEAAKGLREAGQLTQAASLASACAKPLRDAADGLGAAAKAIDAGTSADTGDVGCALVSAAGAVADVAPILARHGVKVPVKAQRFLEFARLFGGMCHVKP